MTITAIDHVQLAMPAGGPAQARAFYCGLLRLVENSKPVQLAARGGCWFASAAAAVHLGVEDNFRPARKAHPAFLVRDYDALLARLAAAGACVTSDEELPEIRCAFVADPFGNRIELIEEQR